MKTKFYARICGLLAVFLGSSVFFSAAYGDEWSEISEGSISESVINESVINEPYVSSYPYSTPMIAGLIIASTAVVTTGGLDSDKRLHFGGSVVLGAISEVAMRQFDVFTYNRWKRIGTAAAVGTIPGLIKELSDSKFDGGDLAADIAGSIVGAILADLMQGPVEMPMWGMDFSRDSLSLSFFYPF